MTHVITSNDTSINIKYIDEEETHYHLNIPNNDINKKLIENTVFKFDKSGTQTIIMHDDNNVFHLSKMECKYSEFIEMKKQLENTEKEVILLKQELSKNEKELVNFKNDLLQQIEKVNDKSIEVDKLKEQINIYDNHSPIVFEYRGGTQTYYGDEQYSWWNNTLTSEQVSKLGRSKLHSRHSSCSPPNNQLAYTMHIPVAKIVILFKESIEIYLSGIHYGIYPSHGLWFGKELDKEEVIISLKKIGYNCNNIIYF